MLHSSSSRCMTAAAAATAINTAAAAAATAINTATAAAAAINTATV